MDRIKTNVSSNCCAIRVRDGIVGAVRLNSEQPLSGTHGFSVSCNITYHILTL
jgi:hypothetical protein